MNIKININNQTFYAEEYSIQNIKDNLVVIIHSLLTTNSESNNILDLTHINLQQCSSNIYISKSNIDNSSLLPQDYIDDVISFMFIKKKETDDYCNNLRISLDL